MQLALPFEKRILKEDEKVGWDAQITNPASVDPINLAFSFSMCVHRNMAPRRQPFAMEPKPDNQCFFIDGARFRRRLVLIFDDSEREYKFLFELHGQDDPRAMANKKSPKTAIRSASIYKHIGRIVECKGDFEHETPEDVLRRMVLVGRFKLEEVMLKTCRVTLRHSHIEFLDDGLRKEFDDGASHNGLLTRSK